MQACRKDTVIGRRIRSRAEGAKRTERGPAVKVLPTYFGRCVLRAERLDANSLRWGGPKRATQGRSVAVCQEPFGFWPGSDTRAWPALGRAIAPQAESTGYAGHMSRPACCRADRSVAPSRRWATCPGPRGPS